MKNILIDLIRAKAKVQINPFRAINHFLYPLKTSENLWFSDAIRGYRKKPMAWNGLTGFCWMHFSNHAILKYRWRNLVEEKNAFNTTSLICTLDYQPQTDEAFKVDGRKHTHTHGEYKQVMSLAWLP